MDFRAFFRRLTRAGRDAELDREIRAHLDLEAEQHSGARLAPEQARAAARRAFGNPALVSDEVRRQWRFSAADRAWREAVQAVRIMRRHPGFTLGAMATLAAAIALNTTALSVANAYLWRSLPYSHAQRLYNVNYSMPGQPAPEGLDSLDWSALDSVVEHAIAWDLDMFYLVGGTAESAPGAWVTPGFMQGLGIRVAMGRTFQQDEFRVGSPQVALISHSLWQRRFGGDPAIVGRRFEAYVSDRPEETEQFTIVGVLPAGFWHVNPYTDVLAPLRGPSHPYMVRLRDGVPPEAAAQRFQRHIVAGAGPQTDSWAVQLRPVHELYTARVRPVLTTISAAAALVLFIACANVAFLLLIRTSRRRREFAVRMALGAGRARVAVMLAVEALLLSAGATAAGVAVSALTLDSLAPVFEQQLGRPAPGGVSAIGIDATVAAAAAAFTACVTLLFALAPLAVLRRDRLAQAVQGGQRAGMGRGGRAAQSALVAAEVAASLALLFGCALMTKTVIGLLQVDFGYANAHAVLTAQLGLRQGRYPDPAPQSDYYRRLLLALSREPGIRAAGLANGWALQPPRSRPIESAAPGVPAEAGVLSVSTEYFVALGTPILQGREFTPADRLGAEPVAVVSQSLARRLWPEGSALGQQVRAGSSRPAGGGQPGEWRRVVGVAADVRQSPSDDDRADLYVPMLQQPDRFAALYIASSGPPPAGSLPAVRRALAEVDAEVSLSRVRPLQEALDDQFARSRFLGALLAAFATFAALLALLGVYGVVAYAVRQREREIAVRMAVGADARAVVRLFLRQAAPLLAAGLAAGVAGALALGGVLETQLFGVAANDPVTLAAAALAFAIAGLGATWWPARRAAGVDPATALRVD